VPAAWCKIDTSSSNSLSLVCSQTLAASTCSEDAEAASSCRLALASMRIEADRERAAGVAREKVLARETEAAV